MTALGIFLLAITTIAGVVGLVDLIILIALWFSDHFH